MNLLTMYFRLSDEKCRNGSRVIPVKRLADFGPIEEAVAKKDPCLLLSRVVFSENEYNEVVSGIDEPWTISGLKFYMENVERIGLSYFSYCEAMKSREPSDFDTPEVFTSFADAGNAVAERYFGVPEGGLKYIMATKLAKDIMNGEGPQGLPNGLCIFAGPDNDPIYMIDANKDAPEPSYSPGMSC